MKWSGGEAYMLHVTYMFRRKMLTCYMLHVGRRSSDGGDGGEVIGDGAGCSGGVGGGPHGRHV